MRYRISEDPFKYKQPPLRFADALIAPVHTCAPAGWNTKAPNAGEVAICGRAVHTEFPDANGLLETAYADLQCFFDAYKMPEGDSVFKTALVPGMAKESYKITVTEAQCLMEAGDGEGIRRAIYFIEDEMKRREGFFLPCGTIERRAVIKTRISRSALVPNYNTGKGELGADIEGYPDAYLDRLAHDGVNAIWVQEHLRVLVPSEVIPEYGKNGEARLAKLNRLIDRAERYGISVYLEGVEPASSMHGNIAIKNHTELNGQQFYGSELAFCLSTEAGAAYIKEVTGRLFKLVPKLKGLLNITIGEACSTCVSTNGANLTCPTCLEKEGSAARALVSAEKAMVEGMRAAKPDAEYISWAYALRACTEETREEYLRLRSKDVISMVNFEDFATVEQEGKKKLAIDYWLSYPGPGPLFKASAEAARETGVHQFAKIQVCSSHEVSTVPYVPVPGILYDKYKYMHEHGVDGVMYCWYFGNYPSVMSKAAGELAFAPFYKTKEDFLTHLAGIYWGRNTKAVVDAYLQFEKGYKNYPLNTCFEWHSPIGDGPAWPLHLEPVDLPISKAYEMGDMVGSDRVGEAMFMGHTHQDAFALCSRMREEWHRGANLLSKVTAIENGEGEEQKSVARALDILFDSGANILEFYLCRNKLAFLQDDATVLLARLRTIAEKEIENAKALAALSEADGRLGYHAEAAAYKFFPEKLMWRVAELEKMLETEFPAVEARIAEGKHPLPYCLGLCEDSHRYETNAGWESFMYKDGSEDESTKIRIREEDDSYTIELWQTKAEEIQIRPEFVMFHPYAGVSLSKDKGFVFDFTGSCGLYKGDVPAEKAKWQVESAPAEDGLLWTVKLLKKDFFTDGEVPFRLSVTQTGQASSYWEKPDRTAERLRHGIISPDSYVFIIPKKFQNLR
ncbi:MAG: hypothetical protein IJD83_02935 [Clostridia bacterium]|nr:hypothetical protein [Clostridia bacterium]